MIRKSIFTLMLLALVGGVSAQALRFEWQGEVFAEGQEVLCTNDEWGYGELIQHMEIRNLTGHDLNVVVEKEVIQVMDGTMNTFCFGNCYGPDTYIGAPVTVAAQSLSTEDLSFHMLYDQVEGTTIMKYYAYDENDPSNKISIVVRFFYDPTGVNETISTMSHAYPNPASSVVRFNVQNADNASVAIYNLLGQEVLRQDVMAGQLNISVADFNEGIYFCNLMVNGQVVKTEKFIVKK